MFDPFLLFATTAGAPGVAVSSTTVYRSRVITPWPGARMSIQVELTGSGAAGVLVGKVNDLPETQYKAAVATAGSEAANTTGWRTVSFKDTDVPSSGVETEGDVDLLVGTKDGVVLNLPPGPFRYRVEFTNSGDPGTLNGYCRLG